MFVRSSRPVHAGRLLCFVLVVDRIMRSATRQSGNGTPQWSFWSSERALHEHPGAWTTFESIHLDGSVQCGSGDDACTVGWEVEICQDRTFDFLPLRFAGLCPYRLCPWWSKRSMAAHGPPAAIQACQGWLPWQPRCADKTGRPSKVN